MTAALSPRRWTPEVHAALTHFLDTAPRGTLAVFDCDNTCIHGDLGEGLHRILCDNLAFALEDPTFLDRFDDADGAQRIRSLWQTLEVIDLDDEPDHPTARALSRALIAAYFRRYRRLGRGPTYRWVTQLLTGMRERTLRAWVEEMLQRELAAPLDSASIAIPGEDPVSFHTGLRVQPEIVELISCMHTRGFEVWIVSASNLWAIQGIAPRLGVPTDRILTHQLEVSDHGVITDRFIEPVTFRQGKVDAIRERIGRRPAFAAGDSVTDLEMLLDATHGRLIIERGDAHIHQAIADSAPDAPPWWVQPAFRFDEG